MTCVITLRLLVTQVREADEKEDTVAMPPPQVCKYNLSVVENIC